MTTVCACGATIIGSGFQCATCRSAARRKYALVPVMKCWRCRVQFPCTPDLAVGAATYRCPLCGYASDLPTEEVLA